MGYVMRRDAGTAEANEPPFLPHAVGEIKYAVVLSREYEDHVVGWGFDADGAVRITQALNQGTEG
jgi:hypothetical protein